MMENIFEHAAYYALALLAGATVAFLVRTRRRGIRGWEFAIGSWAYFFGAFLVIGLAAHNAKIIWQAVNGTSPGGGGYDFRLYGLLLFGAVMIASGISLMRGARAFANSAETGTADLMRHSLIVAALNIPVIPIKYFGTVTTVIAVVNLILIGAWALSRNAGPMKFMNKILYKRSLTLLLIVVIAASAIPAIAQTRQAALRSAPATVQTGGCKGGWSGSITYRRTIDDNYTEKKKNIVKGTTDHTRTRNYSYSGRIQVSDWKEMVVGIAAQLDNKRPKAQVTMKDETKLYRRSVGQDACFYQRGLREQSITTSEQETANAFGDGIVDGFDLNVLKFNNTYNLSFTLPAAKGLNERTAAVTSAGFCNEKNNNTKNDTRRTEIVAKGEGFSVRGQQLDPKNPDVLAGSITKDVSYGNVTSFITVTWNLRRCPAPLELEAIEFDEHPYPDFKTWRRIDSDTVDGNQVRIRARVVNYSNETKYPKLVFSENRARMTLPGGEVDAAIVAGESREISLLWDTRGFAWETGSKPASDRQIKVEMTEASVPKKERTADILIVPRPVILIHGLWADYTAWNGYDRNFKMAHSVSWNSYAVGADPENGLMNTGEKGSPKPTKAVSENAEELKKQIEFIRKRNNAWHVDLVGHSMGGIIGRYYIQNLMPNVPDGVPAVTRLVQLGTPNMGSPCATLVDFLFFTHGVSTRAVQQLTPLWMERFNQSVRERRGTKFSVLVGNALPQTCQSSSSGDGVVEIHSARWEISDFRYADAIHTALTEPLHFTSFVLPRLAVSHRVEQASPIDYGAAVARRYETHEGIFVNASFTRGNDNPALPPGLRLDASKLAEIQPGQAVEMDVPVAANAVAGIVFAAPSSVSASLIDDKRAVVVQSPANSNASSADFRTLPIKAAASGVWKLRLQNTGDRPASAAAAAWTDVSGSRVSFSLEVGKADPAGHVTLTARLTENGAPLSHAAVVVQIVDASGTASEVVLKAAQPGVYLAISGKLSAGEHTATARADVAGKMFVSGIGLSVGNTPVPAARSGKAKK